MFIYIFLDEAGNFDFSPTGTKYFVLTALTRRRPFHAYKALTELKYDLIEQGLDLEYFHAAEDRPETRDQVFDVIFNHLGEVGLDSLVVEKKKTDPALQIEDRFYLEVLGCLLEPVLKRLNFRNVTEVIVVAERISIQRKHRAVEKAIKKVLTGALPQNIRCRILQHDVKSDPDLQMAGYCNWAIFRKWEEGDTHSYARICRAIESELEFNPA